MKKTVSIAVVVAFIAGLAFGGQVPSVKSAAFAGWFTNSFRVASGHEQQDMAVRFFAEIGSLATTEKIDSESLEKIDALLPTVMNQAWWDKYMSYPDCRYSFHRGIVISEKHNLPKIRQMYEKAINASGRPAAIKLFKKYGRRLTNNELTKEFADLNLAVEYLNTELYYDVNTAASQICIHMMKLKHDQLIDAGYPVWRVNNKGKFEYSDGAKELLRYCEMVIKSFNEPYFFGLNSKLQEIGVSARFNPVNVVSAPEAMELSRKILFDSIVIDDLDRWMLRVSIGVNGFNELIDRKIVGDAKLREKTGNDPSKVKK